LRSFALRNFNKKLFISKIEKKSGKKVFFFNLAGKIGKSEKTNKIRTIPNPVFGFQGEFSVE